MDKQIGGYYTCPDCTHSYHSSEVHLCDTCIHCDAEDKAERLGIRRRRLRDVDWRQAGLSEGDCVTGFVYTKCDMCGKLTSLGHWDFVKVPRDDVWDLRCDYRCEHCKYNGSFTV